MAAFSSAANLGFTFSLDHEVYLPSEAAMLTVVVRNPTSQPLTIPTPFTKRTGGCFLLLLSENGGEIRHLGADGDYHAQRYSVPTTVLAPGQEVIRTIRSTDIGPDWKGTFKVPTTSGRYRLRYGYDDRIYADFRVVVPTKVTAMSMLELPPEEMMDYDVRKLVVKIPKVFFLAVETSNGERWLVRSDPMPLDISYRFNARNTANIFNYMPYFEDVGRLEEETTSLRAELRADGTVDVTAVGVSGHQSVLNLPARPAKSDQNSQ
jgi:hypothetical protein